MVTFFVPGDTGIKKPFGIINFKIWSKLPPPPAVIILSFFEILKLLKCLRLTTNLSFN